MRRISTKESWSGVRGQKDAIASPIRNGSTKVGSKVNFRKTLTKQVSPGKWCGKDCPNDRTVFLCDGSEVAIEAGDRQSPNFNWWSITGTSDVIPISNRYKWIDTGI